MREIKFRAWHKEQGKMYSAEEMGKDQLTLMPDGRGFANISSCSTRLSGIDNSRKMIPLQFTGLKDKNGTEIYEGDIVDGFGNRFVVKWGIFRFRKLTEYEDVNIVDVPSFAFTLEGDIPRYTIVKNFKGEHDLKGLEVIGNIHENPELLED